MEIDTSSCYINDELMKMDDLYTVDELSLCNNANWLWDELPF